jgi:hypothetical protein
MMRPARLLAVAFAIVGCARAGGVGQIEDLTDASIGDGADPDGPPPIDAAQQATLQQTVDNTIAAANSIACRWDDTLETAELSWYRVFALAEHNVADRPFYVQQVTFAVQQSQGGPVVQVKLGTYSGAMGTDTLDLTKVTPLNSATVAAPATQTGAMAQVPITATVPPNSQLIVEIHNPDQRGTGGKRIFIGASVGAEVAGRTGYYRAPQCMRPTPTTVALAGAPSAHLIITVTGQY